MVTAEIATLDTREVRRRTWDNFEKAYILNRALVSSGFGEKTDLGQSGASITLTTGALVRDLETLKLNFTGKSRELLNHIEQYVSGFFWALSDRPFDGSEAR